MCLQNGSRLEPIGGIDLDKGKHCTIVDKGLPGLQHCFGTLKAAESTPTDENWRSRLALLSSPQFWRYDSSAKEWVHDQDRHSGNSSPGTVDAPQGGVPQQNFSPEATPQPQESPTKRRHRTKKVAGKCVKQLVRTKLDFISMRQAARRANKTDQPMFLCVVRATQEPGPKGKRRRSRAGAAKGMTEGEKRKLSKETGPVVKEVSITDTIRSKVAEADAAVREQLQATLEEYRDVFPDKLPYGPPPRRVVDHEIETTPGAAPPHKSPYRLSTAEQDELRRQIDTLLEQGWIRPSSSPYGAPILFIPKKDGKWSMCWTTGL